MRFMMIMIPRVYQPDVPPGEMPGESFAPPPDAVSRMTKFNEELAKSGALLALEGLQPSSKGARVAFNGGKPRTIDGPFAGAKEVIGGYWLIDVPSKQQAIDWARKCPAVDGDVIEIRQVFEMSDFPADVQKAAESATVSAQVGRRRGS